MKRQCVIQTANLRCFVRYLCSLVTRMWFLLSLHAPSFSEQHKSTSATTTRQRDSTASTAPQHNSIYSMSNTTARHHDSTTAQQCLWASAGRMCITYSVCRPWEAKLVCLKVCAGPAYLTLSYSARGLWDAILFMQTVNGSGCGAW